MSHFSPTSALIWEGFDDAQLQGDLEYLRAVALQGRENSPDVVEASIRVATHEHELMHYRQHIGTTLGAFDYRVAVARLMLLGAVAVSLGAEATLQRLAIGRPRGRQALAATGNTNAKHYANVSYLVGVTSGVMWKKNARVGDMRRTLENLDAAFRALQMAEAADLRIEFDAADDESTGAGGLVSVELLTEGFARFREYVFLKDIVGEERCFGLWKLTGTPTSESSIGFIQDALSVPIDHPLVGAIHDVALSACPDPAGNMELFRWSKHHPGLRFRRIVESLRGKSSGIIADAWRIGTAYELTAKAAGIEPGAMEARYERLAQRLSADNAMLRPRQVLQSAVAALRGSVPFVLTYAPEIATNLIQKQADALTPFALVQPSRVTNPWKELDRRALLSDALLLLMADRIRAGQSLRPVKDILRRLDPEEAVVVTPMLVRSAVEVFPGTLVESLFEALGIGGTGRSNR